MAEVEIGLAEHEAAPPSRSLRPLATCHPNSLVGHGGALVAIQVRKVAIAEGREFESRFPLQNTYTLRKAGRFAQPYRLKPTTMCFPGRGLALLRRHSAVLVCRSPLSRAMEFDTPQPSPFRHLYRSRS